MPMSGGSGSAAAATDATLSVSDITTNNASTSAHGFLKKLPNDATQFMGGTGLWSVPAGSGGGSAGAFSGASVYNSANQTITGGGSGTTVLFDSEHFDTDAFHSTGSNTGRLTIPSGGGKYVAVFNGALTASDSDAAANVQIHAVIGGSDVIVAAVPITGLTLLNITTPILDLAAADYLYVIIFTGSNRTLSFASRYSPEFSIAKVAGAIGTVSVPTVTQAVSTAGVNTTNPAVTIAAAASGQRLIVGVNLVGRGATSITCTNVTFTQMITVTSGGGSRYEIWVGVVAGGSSGTTLTVNTGSSNFSTVIVHEVADALTPTAAGTPYSAAQSANPSHFGPFTGTAGRFFAALIGSDNTTTGVLAALSCPHYLYSRIASGTGLALAVGYVPSGSISGWFSNATGSALYTIIQEVT
jgi:hypothetical protein